MCPPPTLRSYGRAPRWAQPVTAPARAPTARRPSLACSRYPSGPAGLLSLGRLYVWSYGSLRSARPPAKPPARLLGTGEEGSGRVNSLAWATAGVVVVVAAGGGDVSRGCKVGDGVNICSGLGGATMIYRQRWFHEEASKTCIMSQKGCTVLPISWCSSCTGEPYSHSRQEEAHWLSSLNRR